MKDRGRKFADVGQHGVDDHLAGFELGEIEHVVDQLEQRLAAGGDRRQSFGAFLFVHDAADEQFGKTDDGVERRADVVADGGEEEALGFFRGDLLVQRRMQIVVVELAFQSRLQVEAVKDIRQRPDESISDKSVDPDFFNRWRKDVEVIDDAAMRIFWARLLVEETCCPNSISPRTLSVARNLSKEEAKTFERLCPYRILDALPLNDKSYPLNGTYKDALLLQEAGLIGHEANAHIDVPENGTFFIPIMKDGFILKADTSRIGVNGYPLTVAGQQIAEIVSVMPDVSIAKKIAREVSAQNHKLTIYLIEKQDGVPDDQAPVIWDTNQPD